MMPTHEMAAAHPERAAGRLFEIVPFAIILAFAAMLLVDAGKISFTWDESTDLGTVSCLATIGNPFACLNEPQQSRLPFYLHAFVARLWPGEYPHYLLSALFGVTNLLIVYVFARRTFGLPAATLTAVLCATSIPLIASGRMLLTHSNVIFTTFTILTVILFYRFVEQNRVSVLVGSAVAFGCSVATSLLGMFSLLMLVPFYTVSRSADSPPRKLHLLFFPVSLVTFFAATVIYFDPAVFVSAVRGTLQGHHYPFWNVFGFGIESPWWFSFLILVVKVGPWWLLLLLAAGSIYFRKTSGIPRMFFASFLGGFTAYLFIKSALFYDAPHHHVAFYPFLYLLISVAAVFGAGYLRRPGSRMVAMILLAICFGCQIHDLWRFFPNYLFYGSQYGDRFVGEFYGPAVFHGQDRDPVNARIDTLLNQRPDVEILVADHNALERSGKNFVLFSQRNLGKEYEYAFVDRLYAVHFTFKETDEYNRYLSRFFVEDYTWHFPPNVWAYRLMRNRQSDKNE